MSKLSWLHLSDLHLQEKNKYERDVVLAHLLNDIRSCIAEYHLSLSAVFITGDIAFAGKVPEYQYAMTFFDELLAVTGLSKDRLILVPGNHDVDRDKITPLASRIPLVLDSPESVNRLLRTPEDRALLFRRLANYNQFVKEYFENRFFCEEECWFVHELELGDKKICVLAINSAWLAGAETDESTGLLLGEYQVRSAVEKAEEADLRITLLHHPLEHLKDFEQRLSAAILLDASDFILHGHVHQVSASQLVSPDSNAIIIGAGACYSTRDYPNLYNLVDIDLDTARCRVILRRYSYERGGFWVRDTQTYRNAPDGVYSFVLNSQHVNGSLVGRATPGRKVLLLENEERWQKRVKHILPEDRYTLEIAKSYEHANSRLKESEFDLIITNLSLGDDPEAAGEGLLNYDGELLLQDIGDLSFQPPCVVLTGSSIEARGIFQRYPWVYTVYTKGAGFNLAEFRRIVENAIHHRSWRLTQEEDIGLSQRLIADTGPHMLE